MPIEILMPALSPTMKEGNLVKWCKKQGDKVSSGELIAEIETDKATMELEACDDGILGLICVAEGTQAVQVNEVIAVLFEEGEEISSYEGNGEVSPPKEELSVSASTLAKNEEVSLSKSSEDSSQGSVSEKDCSRIKASPLARKVARQEKIDLSRVVGTGPRGRIVRADVDSFLQGSPGPQTASFLSSASLDSPSSEERHIDLPISSMRKVIAQRLTESKTTVPHFYVTSHVIMDPLLALRGQLNEALAEKGEKLTLNDFFIKACALALVSVPEANVSWHNTFMRQYHHADIAVAVSIEGGLVTPVLREAHSKSLRELSSEMKDLSRRARTNKLSPHEYQGGSFTISNMGMYDVTSFCAILNPPHSCILAIGSSQENVGIHQGEIKKITQVSLTLSVDHRAVDGSVAARFLQDVKRYIESPALLLSL